MFQRHGFVFRRRGSKTYRRAVSRLKRFPRAVRCVRIVSKLKKRTYFRGISIRGILNYNDNYMYKKKIVFFSFKNPYFLVVVIAFVRYNVVLGARRVFPQQNRRNSLETARTFVVHDGGIGK